MLSLLRDLLWWCGSRAWRALRTMSGDDAWERHMARERPRADGASIPAPPSRRERREIYDRELDRKWSRHAACGRCFER